MQIVLVGKDEKSGEREDLPMEIMQDGHIVFEIRGKRIQFDLKDFDDSEAFLKSKLKQEK